MLQAFLFCYCHRNRFKNAQAMTTTPPSPRYIRPQVIAVRLQAIEWESNGV